MPDFDVVVCGAGPSGVTAGLSAARLGAHTLLLERYGFGGGASTAALVYPWMTFHSRRGRQVIGGIAQEIVDRLVEEGASPGHLRDTIGFAYSVTPFDAEVYKLLIDQLLIEAGVEIRYHTFISGVEASDGRIQEIKTVGKEGEKRITARIYIDSTGDGDIAAGAGIPFVIGRRADGKTQPMSMNFIMGGVDLEAVKHYMQKHPEDFHSASLIEELDRIPLTGISGFFSLWKRYGPPEIPRDRTLFFAGIHPAEVVVNTTRVLNYIGTTSEDLTQAEIKGRQQVGMLVEFCRKYLPGFRDSYLVRMPVQVGIRESRHIIGFYTLMARDIVEARRFPDVIARSGYPLDIHDPSGEALESDIIQSGDAYDIPYRCLLPQQIDNLLVNGRCTSSTHTASSSTRLTPSCMAIGQAAGTAAAMAAQRKIRPARLPVDELQAQLELNGAILH